MAVSAGQGDLQGVERTVSRLLASHQMPLPATFSYDFLGMTFDVGVRRDPEGSVQLVVRGQLGNLPYSAESVDARNLLNSIVDAGHSMTLAEISLDRNQAIVVRGAMTFPSVPSPATIAAGTAAITVAVKPVCELVVKCREITDQNTAWQQSA